MKFDCVSLGYFISNKQNRYLRSLDFMRICDNVQQAKETCDNLKASLLLIFGKENLEEGINDQGSKQYQVFQTVRNDWGKSIYGFPRIVLYFAKIENNRYGVMLSFNGFREAGKMVMADDQ